MMMSLFSPFNPSSWMNIMNNWMIMLMIPMMMKMKMWKINPKTNLVTKIINQSINTQFKNMMSKSMKMNTIMMMTTMNMILMMNLMSMFPYTYALTAMPQVGLPMALSMWMAINMKKATNKMKFSSNLLPTSTPGMLMPMMIIIESTSMIIQPITLSVRLMANITAGHMILILISSAYSLKMIMMFTLITQIIMSMMEICVSAIQAYVFAMLLTMFNK